MCVYMYTCIYIYIYREREIYIYIYMNIYVYVLDLQEVVAAFQKTAPGATASLGRISRPAVLAFRCTRASHLSHRTELRVGA